MTLVHKGNIQKFTEGMFMKWGYALAKREFPDRTVSWEECGGKPPAGKLLIKDAITDAFLQQILTRPDEFDVIAAPEPHRRPPVRRPRRPGGRDRHRARAGTSTTRPATPSSRRPTGPRRSTRGRTR